MRHLVSECLARSRQGQQASSKLQAAAAAVGKVAVEAEKAGEA